MKKGRHRRFEEARALKQAFDLGLTPGSTLMEAQFDDGDDYGFRSLPGADFSDLTIVLWLSAAPTAEVSEAVASAIDDWYDEMGTGDGVFNNLEDGESGTSPDGRWFMTWWADFGTKPKSAVASLSERLSSLHDDGMPIAGLEIGGSVPSHAG